MITIIMAGGLGSRMKSLLPKVLHIINDYPMIYYVIQNALTLGSSKILIVVGKYKSIIKEYIDKYFPRNNKIEYITQESPNGTGHAIQCCVYYLITANVNPADNILILSGDVPLITVETLQKLLYKPNTLLITKTDTPFGNGRIIFDDNNKIMKIIEEKDCTEKERQIQYINCGIYNITVQTLLDTVPYIQNLNKASEYYLTDFVDLAVSKNVDLHYYELPKEEIYQVININTIEELVQANEIIFTKNSFI
jgi:bifunctional N-acetylglucosamine-1-phosphate-uridyltransferase/glucosamine-1-phosphate-acetyltransferase GlmU-like protein